MALSSNSIMHFTREKDSLFGIFKENFKISFCREAIVLNGEESIYRVPMVSFCDIPMSEIKEHIEKYGSYGIGLTKEWALKKGLNPVVYVAQKSDLSKSYKIAMDYFLKAHPENATEIDVEGILSLLDFLRYIKNYEGPLHSKNFSCENYRFSDEREWRYVPPISIDDGHMMVVDKDFRKNPEIFKKIYEFSRLEFEPNDIKYIIIKDDSEIKDVSNYLQSIKGGSYYHDDIERLKTRILTAKQIKEDF